MTDAGASSAAVAEGADILVEKPNGVLYCRACDMNLNGPTHWEEHRIGKKHAKKLKEYQRLDGVPPPPPPSVDPADLPKVFSSTSGGHTITIRRDAMETMCGTVLTDSDWSWALDCMSWCCRTRPYSPGIARDILEEVSASLRESLREASAVP